MADFTRDVGGITPTNYIRPGVQKPSPLSLVAEVADQAIDLDVQLAREKLRKDADALHTTYETSAPGAQAVQEETEQNHQLSAGDQKQVDSLKSSMANTEAAVQQGKMSFDEYRVRGERLLRMAISKRPGLAQEFRAVAAMHLGTDVVGASVDRLASWERQYLAAQNKKDEQGGPDFKRMRDQLDAIGVPNGHMTEEQVMTQFMSNMSAIQEFAKHQAQNEIMTTASSTLKAGQELNRPTATVAFVQQVQKDKLDVYRNFSQGFAAVKSGQLTPDQLTTVINNGQLDLSGRVSALRASMAAGDVDPDIAEKEIAGLEELSRQMEELASGKLTNDILQKRMDGLMLYMQNAMMDNEAVVQLASATKLFSPEIMTGFVQPGGSFNKTAATALGHTINNTGSPLTKAANAGTNASNVIMRVLDRGGAKSNPKQVVGMNQVLVNAATSFVELSPKDFRSDYLTGSNGLLTVVERHAGALGKALSEEQQSELLGALSMATLSNYYALAQSMGSKYPALPEKVRFDLDPMTGLFVQPKKGVTLTGAEQRVVQQYNAAFAGRKVLSAFQQIAGVDAKQARDMIFSGNEAYKESKKAGKGKPPVVVDLLRLGDQYGFKAKSTVRTKEENDALPGSAKNSKHLTGEAVDFSVKGKSAEEISAFAAKLRGAGYQVVTTPHGTGPHIHAEKD